MPPTLDLESCFRSLYGRAPVPEETAQVRSLVENATDDASMLRGILAFRDQQSHPTPFRIKLLAERLTYANFREFELALDPDDRAISSMLRQHRCHEPHVERVLRRYVRRGMTVVDVGANLGYFTLLSSRMVGDAGKVFAFEANPENCRLLALSVLHNDIENVRIHPLALADRNGFSCFSPHIGTNGGFVPTNREVLTSGFADIVPCARLDNLVDERIDFVKLDVAGAEYSVLRGAEPLLESYRPIICSEFSLEMTERVSGVTGIKLLAFLDRLSYRASVISRDSSRITEIHDPERFLANWGARDRIEDLLFVPRESEPAHAR